MNDRPRRLTRTPLAAILALFALLAVLLGACSSSGSSPGPPSGQAAATAPASGAAGSGQSGAVEFAQCMRSHGVPDFPDPQNGRFLVSGADQDNPNFNSAIQACQHLLGPNGINGGGGGSSSSQLLAFAHCMQTHGVPAFPDPAPNGAIQAPSGIDRNSPQFQKAWQECQSKLPGNLQGQQP
jgi:hypothetical protein